MRRLGWSQTALEQTNKAEKEIDRVKSEMAWEEMRRKDPDVFKGDYVWDSYGDRWYTIDGMAKKRAINRWRKKVGSSEKLEDWEYDPDLDAMIRKED